MDEYSYVDTRSVGCKIVRHSDHFQLLKLDGLLVLSHEFEDWLQKLFEVDLALHIGPKEHWAKVAKTHHLTSIFDELIRTSIGSENTRKDPKTTLGISKFPATSDAAMCE
jgi:hypothetical protein